MNGSTWTRAVAAVVGALLLLAVIACGGGAPRNPTPTPSRSASAER